MTYRSTLVVAGTFASVIAYGASSLADAGAPFHLDTTCFGTDTTFAAAGDVVPVEIALTGDGATFNSALFRLVLTEENATVVGYEWAYPFDTGGFTDFSLEGLTLPVVVTDTTLAGPGYPASIADVEFGNFLFGGDAHEGPIANVFVRVPEGLPAGSTFFVVAVPDLVMDGFFPLDIEVGELLSITIVEFRRADLDRDGVVGPSDLAIVLGAFGRAGDPPRGQGDPDINGDGVVNAIDLGVLLGDWG